MIDSLAGDVVQSSVILAFDAIVFTLTLSVTLHQVWIVNKLRMGQGAAFHLDSGTLYYLYDSQRPMHFTVI